MDLVRTGGRGVPLWAFIRLLATPNMTASVILRITGIHREGHPARWAAFTIVAFGFHLDLLASWPVVPAASRGAGAVVHLGTGQSK
ncbi:hypothetical protein ACFQ05_26660 [Amycolatopsis umgeniensis]|uniref:Uncharacterized protein n=1 Tax=Amycolatopsis umgeniensis TaxID=336628 RepID=A0A841BCM7_9PSEU|nr:hypothetical protein [Amycolatopsis umgeniensis]MBB5856468.1 hypothetical protein [Amycolatopsis umgeniensis]